MPDYRKPTPRPPQQHIPAQESEAESYLKANTVEILNFLDSPVIDQLLTQLKAYAGENGSSMTTSQLRNIFSKVKPINSRQKLQMIRPKLAYVAARQKSSKAEQVVNFLEDLIKNVENDAQVKNFVAFFEAFVAYHKFFDSKKSA